MSISGEVVPVGDAAVMAVVGDTIDVDTCTRVWSLHAMLVCAFGDAALDIIPAYGSVLVRFDPGTTQLAIAMATVRGALEQASPVARTRSDRTIDVGVCFDALDIDDVSRHTGMSAEEIVAEFCAAQYRVAFVGFSAGFPYLIGLPKHLVVPRLPTPRVRVPAGSVALAAGQAGIYPRATPGGWRIIGRTNAPVFDVARGDPALFRAGDVVRFRAVSTLDAALASIA